MTVVGEKTALGVELGRVTCEWFEKNKPMQADFAETSLKVVHDDGGTFNVMGRYEQMTSCENRNLITLP